MLYLILIRRINIMLLLNFTCTQQIHKKAQSFKKMLSQGRQRPNLTIETNSDENEQKSDTKFILPSIKSAKNNHQMKKFNFNQAKTITPFDKIIKMDRIEKLQKEKRQLMESLEILKNGAVNAIVQKQEIIEKLRKLFNQGYVTVGGDRDDSKVQELQTLLQYIRDLEDQRKQLKAQLERSRLRFQMQIQEKQQIIQQITNELNWSIQRIDNLQKYDRLLEEKIKVMEQSNQNLSVLLNQSQQNLKDERKKYTQQNQLLKNRSSESFNHTGSDSQNGSSWNKSYYRKVNKDGSQKDLNISLSRSLDQSIIQSKIQQLKNQHLVQIQDLTDFYEARIQSYKKVCQKFPQQYFSEKTNNTKINNNTNVVSEVHDNNSSYSGFTNQIRQQRNKEIEKILKKNHSLGSFKSGIFKMDPIDQKQQIENPGRTLKKQLSQFQSFADGSLKKTTSQLSIANSNSSKSSSKKSNQQKQSQYSYKCFEYPAASFKKNKSQMSNTKSEASTPRIIPKKIQDRIDSSSSTMQKSEEKSSPMWDKLFWFASGTITGGLLLKYGNKLFK